MLMVMMEIHFQKVLKKKKAWRKLQPELGTNDSSICVWNGLPMRTKSGVLSVASLKGAMLK